MVTVTGYPREYDAGTPPPAVVAEAMRTIADSFGPERVSWRYDPILFSRQCPPAHHVEQFKYIAGMLQGATERVIVSLLEPYGKIKPRLKALVGGNWEIVTPTAAMLQETMPALQGLAREHDITMQRCAQPVSGPASLAAAGVSAGACLDAAWFQQRLGWHVDATKDQGQRAQCLCSSSRDIGMYESCPRGCVYCYAVSHFSVARRNWKAHDAAGLSLL